MNGLQMGGALALALISLSSTPRSEAAAPCNEADTVGGGALGVSPGPNPPAATLGWDVGSGQCNGSFTVTRHPGFPGGALELGMRAEQRRVGQVANVGGDYEVQAGADPTQAGRAWWNFQHSIAYQGNIADIDELTFTIRTDYGTSVPATPVDMHAVRAIIDARRVGSKPTAGYVDLYQTSQNPVFNWFTSGYDMNAEGAWRLFLTAVEDGHEASVTICIHTPGRECAIEPLIDVRPGVAKNAINTNAKQLVPIAILASATFDPVTEVDPTGVLARGAEPKRSTASDVNGDGLDDLVLEFRARDMDKPNAEECADPAAVLTLTGSLYSGRALIGTDLVDWQGPDCE